MAMAKTTNLLLRAKSTSARIISCPRSLASVPVRPASLPEHVVEYESVRYHLLAGRQTRLDFLQIHVVFQEIPSDDFNAPELVAGRRNVDEIPVMHVQDGGCRNDGVHFRGLTTEGGRHEHGYTHISRIRNFYPNLSR